MNEIVTALAALVIGIALLLWFQRPRITPPQPRAPLNWSWITTPVGYLTAPFRSNKAILALIALVAVILLLWNYGTVSSGYSANPNWHAGGFWSAKWQKVPYWVLLLAVAFFILAAWFGDKKKLLSGAVMGGIIVMTYVTYLFYKDGTIVGDVGMIRNVMYLIAIGLVVLAAQYITNNWQRIVATLLFLWMFTMLGFSSFLTWREFAEYIPFHRSTGSSLVASTPSQTTSDCDGKLSVLPYAAGSVYRVNSPSCQLRAYVMSGCVTWMDIGLRPLGRTCNGPVTGVAPGIQHMRADSTAVVRINHCKNYATGILVDVCA